MKIYHAKKSLLLNEGDTWMKEEGLFDMTVGSYDGLEVCEIVGPFLFDKISGRYDRRSISLYCDDE